MTGGWIDWIAQMIAERLPNRVLYWALIYTWNKVCGPDEIASSVGLFQALARLKAQTLKESTNEA